MRQHRVVRRMIRLVASVLIAFPAAIAQDARIDGDRLLAKEHVADIQIRLPDADWNQLCDQARSPRVIFSGVTEQRPYTYFKADLWIDGVKVESVGVRKKGFFGSLDSRRPSLKVKFDEFVKQAPVKGLDRLTLNNNKQDKSLLSQLLTYELFRAAGIHAPRSSFARVTVNDEYLGLYSHVESIKEPFLAKRFANASGNLYEMTLADFHPRAVEKLEVKTNKDTNDRSDVSRLAEVLAASGPLDLEKLGTIIDVDNFMRFWAMEALCRFWDGYTSNQNNVYFYMNPENGLGYFIPWGADWVLTDGGPFASFNRSGTAVYAESILANRLYKADGMAQRYRDVMLQLLDQVWNEKALLAEIDRVENQVTPHLHERQRGSARATRQVREFIASRREQLQEELEAWPADVPPKPRKPMYTVPVGRASGSFATTWSERAPEDITQVGSGKLKLRLDGEDVSFKLLGVAAFASSRRAFRGFGGFGRDRGSRSQRAATQEVTIRLIGVRRGDEERYTLSLTIDRKVFEQSGREPIDVSGSLTKGRTTRRQGFGFGGGRNLKGTLRLEKSATSAAEAVVGTIDLQIAEVRGGFFNRR